MSVLSATNRWSLIAGLTSARSLSTAKDEVTFNPSADFTSANQLYSISTALTGSSDSYNLSNGSLTNGIGDAISLTHVNNITFQNISANSFQLGTASSAITIFNSAMTISRGEYFNWYSENGVACGSSVGNKINISGTSGDTYKLIVIGIQ